MSTMRGCWVLPVLAACSTQAGPPPPMRSATVRLGDCAPVGTTWVSGPRPQPFESAPTVDPHGGLSVEPEYMPIYGDAPSDTPVTQEPSVVETVLEARYRPGGGSPLARATIELGRCFALGRATWGTAVITLSGADPVAHGADAPVNACLAKLPLRSSPLECSVAFGTHSAGELPGVTIETAPPSLDVPATRLPVAVRPAPQTPMKLVRATLTSLQSAGHDTVLAAKRGTAWQLVSPFALPVVPTPGASGARWNHASYPQPIEPLPWLEVMVTATGVTFTESRKMQEVGRDQLGQLPSRLVAMRAQGDRAITVTAHDDVTYNRVVEVLDVLTAAGFTEWSVK